MTRRTSKWTMRVGTAVAFVWVTSMTAVGQEKRQSVEPENKDKKLGERLIRKAVTDSDEDLMESMIRLMTQAARRLEIVFDAGEETQALQRRIMDQLDEAVKVAASQRRPTRSTQRGTNADKRRMPKGQQRAGETGMPSQEDPQDRSSSKAADAVSHGGLTDGKSVGGDLREARRTWGHLPMREREEIIQGVTDRFLERYRAWIERYYRALQETEE